MQLSTGDSHGTNKDSFADVCQTGFHLLMSGRPGQAHNLGKWFTNIFAIHAPICNENDITNVFSIESTELNSFIAFDTMDLYQNLFVTN